MRSCIRLIVALLALCPFLIQAAREQSHKNVEKAIAKAIRKAKLEPTLSVEEIATRLDPLLDPLEDGIYANRRITEALRLNLQDVVCEENAAGYLRRRERNRIRTRRQLQREGALGRGIRPPRRDYLDPDQEKKRELTREKTRVALQGEMNTLYAKMHQIHLNFKESPRRFVQNIDFLKGNLTSNQYGRVLNGLMDQFEVKDDWRKSYSLQYKNRQRRLRKGKEVGDLLDTSDDDMAEDIAIRNARYRSKGGASTSVTVDGHQEGSGRYVTRSRSKKEKEPMQISNADSIEKSIDFFEDYQDEVTEEIHQDHTQILDEATTNNVNFSSNSKGGPSRPLHDFTLPYNWYTADDTSRSLQDLHLDDRFERSTDDEEKKNSYRYNTFQTEEVMAEEIAESQLGLAIEDDLIEVQPHFSVAELLGDNIDLGRNTLQSRWSRGGIRPTVASITVRNRLQGQ